MLATALSARFVRPSSHIRMSISGASATIPRFPFARPHGAEPPALFKELREQNPVSKVEMWNGSHAWLIVRHEDVCKVLSDNRFSKIRTCPGFPELSAGGKAAAQAKNPTFVDMDPPQHTIQRGMVEPVFTHEAIEMLRPSIQQTVNERIEAMKALGKQPLDLYTIFSMPVPSKTIFHLLGIPDKDMAYLNGCNAVRTNGSATSAEAQNASDDLNKYLDNLCREKEKNPGDDLISMLAERQVKPGNLTHEDLVQVTFLSLVAGNATMVSMIALAIVTLLQHPDQLAELKKDPSLLNNALEEVLRYHTASALATRRVAKEDVEVAGQMIKAGDGLICSNQSANRDERVFKDADNFDIHRKPGPHLGFGYGQHVCIAQWLARVELQCAVGSLIKSFPNLRLAIPFDEVKYTEPTRDLGITELPVRWD